MRAILWFVVLICALFQPGHTAELQVDRSQANQVKFISDAPLESFSGVTDKIDGYVLWEGDDPTNNSELYFEVDLASINTGIGLRDRHMRENYLETDKYPFAQFNGKAVEFTKSESEEAFQVSVEGKMTIHGKEKFLSISGKVLKEVEIYKVTGDQEWLRRALSRS